MRDEVGLLEHKIIKYMTYGAKVVYERNNVCITHLQAYNEECVRHRLIGPQRNQIEDR